MQALLFAKICSLQISSRNWSHVHGNLLKSGGFYRFFLNINGISFCFHFLQGMFSHSLCYLIKRALFKARKSWIFKIPSLRPRLQVSKSSPLQKVSEGIGDRFILTKLKIIYTRFGSSQPPVSLQITTKKITEKGADLFIKYILRLILCGFLLPRRHLFFI